ncbi:MAG: hypothetical protein WA622_20735 [Mycobacterium sp.]
MTGQPPKLYIFPHAGGSAEYYVPFAKAFLPRHFGQTWTRV